MYNAAISACEKGGEWTRALQLLEAMVQGRVERDTIAYSAAISLREGRRVDKGAAAPGPDDAGQGGEGHHHVQRCHQRLREGR